MNSTQNPFPGMNPFLERAWQPVHTALITYMWEEIASRLPSDLIVRPEERIAIDETEPTSGFRPDVVISESWKQGKAPSWRTEGGTESVVAVTPEILWVEDEIERWLEIQTQDGHLVTVIEVISPVNKEDGRGRYKLKQHRYFESTASLVEIDLLRRGRSVLPLPDEWIQKRSRSGTHYFICCSRGWRLGSRELYTCPLRERLPAFQIPLRSTDKDIVLDIQPLIDRIYEVGRYYLGRFDSDPEPPFPPDEAAWVDERLRAAGLRL
jgi:hypothetical protein